MPQRYLIFDYETRSEADIKLTGHHEYARHPSTKILCVAWRIGTKKELKSAPTRVWSPAIPSPYGELKRALLDPSIMLVAHNVGFERAITKYVLSKIISDPGIKEIPTDRWICTMSMACALALPAKLEKACAALSLSVQKDMEGHRLMLKMSKPRKPKRGNKKTPGEDPNKVYWHQKKSDLERLMQYCATDIGAEVELFLTIPPLSTPERETWLLDQKINDRGFLADRFLVTKILGMIPNETARFEKLTEDLTDGEVQSTNQCAALLRWLKNAGVFLPNLQKETVSAALASGLVSDRARDLLEVRSNSSKTSTAKYEAFEMRSRIDGRVRDNIAYHAASTGRFGGRGVQPHNFPAKGTLQNPEAIIEILKDPFTDLELIRLLYGNPLLVFSSCLRSMIQASFGKELLGGDFNAIEVRVLFWIARHIDGLNAFSEEGREIYIEQAMDLYRKPFDKISKPERGVGKAVVLGAGFGMGPPKFVDTCKKEGREITLEFAKLAISSYREKHAPVTQVWKNLERAAIAAVQNPLKKYTVNRVSWFMGGKFLYCELPNGRRLAYYGPEIKIKETPWGEPRATLYHWDIHPKTKKWVFTHTYGGKLTENVVQAIARDVMVDSMKRAEKRGMELLLTVHDELLTENKIGVVSVKEFEDMMSETETWAEGLPIKVEGWTGPRFRK